MHKLVLSVGRYFEKYQKIDRDKNNFLEDEIAAFRLFCKEAIFHKNCSSDLEWMAVAQHHGLATRLINWSCNSLVALYFSCYKDADADGAVYVLNPKIEFVSLKDDSKIDPFEIKKVSCYLPRHITDRIRAQSGVFTIHPDPTVQLDDGYVFGIIYVPQAVKRFLKSELNAVGVNHKSLFPDVDGLSNWIRWMKFDCIDH